MSLSFSYRNITEYVVLLALLPNRFAENTLSIPNNTNALPSYLQQDMNSKHFKTALKAHMSGRSRPRRIVTDLFCAP